MTSEKRRQKEESNYYFILGLDFRKPELSKKVIEKVMEEKRAEWSGNLNNAEKKAEAEKCLELIRMGGEFESIMLVDDENSLSRIKEAEAAKKIADDEINSHIEIFRRMKSIKTSGIKAYIKENARYFITLENFREQLKKFGIEEVDDIKKQREFSYNEVEEKLKIIKKSTLYSFLFFYMKDKKDYMSSDDICTLDPGELKENAKKISNEMNNKPNKIEKDRVIKELADYCTVLLGDPKEKEKYDHYLSSIVLPPKICRKVEAFGLNGSIDAVQAKELMNHYKRLRPELSEGEIKENLKKEFIKRKILNYEFPQGSDAGSKFQRCNICNRLAGIESKNCPFCGEPFFLQCFHCGVQVESGFDYCSKCGTNMHGK